MSKRAPRNLHIDFLSANRKVVVKTNRCSHFFSAIERSLHHLMNNDYHGAMRCEIYTTNGKQLATIVNSGTRLIINYVN